jgi:hypothetical protein
MHPPPSRRGMEGLHVLAAAAAMFGDHQFGDAPISVFLTHPAQGEAPKFATNSSFLSSLPTFQGLLASLSALSLPLRFLLRIPSLIELLCKTFPRPPPRFRRILISFILWCCSALASAVSNVRSAEYI